MGSELRASRRLASAAKTDVDPYVSGDAVLQSVEAAQLEGDAVLTQLKAMFPEVAQQKDLLSALIQDRAHAKFYRPPAARFSAATRMWARAKAALLLVAVLWSLPLSLLAVAASVLSEWSSLAARGGSAEARRRAQRGLQGKKATTALRGTAIVSGAKSTKGLHVCRHLHRAGWRVVLVDVHRNWASGSRLSACVAAFRTYPEPNMDPLGYLEAIQRIAEEQHATLFVPVSIAQYSVYEALAAQRLGKLGCAACTLDAPSVALLNDKLKFSALCAKLGVAAPQCFAVTSARQLAELNSRPEVFGGRRFLLKSIHYDATHRADLFTLPCSAKALADYARGLDISPVRPWMLQRLLAGTEYSSYTLAHRGKILAHSDNEACLSCLDYAHVGSQQIWEWTRAFCEGTQASGQLCFDFMKDAQDGRMYAFECNPRASTILLNFYRQPEVAAAFFNPQELLDSGRAPLQPLASARPIVWLWNEVGELLFGRLPRCRSLANVWAAITEKAGILVSSKDALLDAADPLPFLGLHYMQVPALLLRTMRVGNPWVKVDLCTGKLVEVGGD